MGKHTPERRQSERRKGAIWERGSRFLILGKPVECIDCSVLDRIATCVNACAGINPEAIPRMVEALEGCSAILSLCGHRPSPQELNRMTGWVRTALAEAKKVEGK